MSTYRNAHRNPLRPTHLFRPAVSRTAAVAALVVTLAACAGPADEASDDTPSTDTTETSSPTTAATPDAPPTTPAEPAPATETTQAPEPAGPSLDVVVAGDEIGPNAEEIDLAVGEELVIRFDADRAGELHVHSKPEQYVQFEAGRTEQILVIETPGEVEVEEHDSGAVVALIQVS